MKMEPSLRIRLEQRMKLAPRILQSIEILQTPLLALEQRVNQELSENPVLEILQENPEADTPEPVATEEPIDDVRSEEEKEDLKAQDEMEETLEDYFEQAYS